MCTGCACNCCQPSIFNHVCVKKFRVKFSTEDHYLSAIIIPLCKAFIYSCSIYISKTYKGHSCCVYIEKEAMLISKMKEFLSKYKYCKFDRLHEEEH